MEKIHKHGGSIAETLGLLVDIAMLSAALLGVSIYKLISKKAAKHGQ